MPRTNSKHENRALNFSRAALACGVLAQLPPGTAAAEPAEAALVRELLERSELQARLFNTGDMQRWIKVVGLGRDFTLMQPSGGATSHGFNPTPERLAELAANFRNGTAKIELEQAITSNDIVVLVYVERQEVEVSGLPMQDWSLRVTQVFLREGDDWKLVHRHADPLVRAQSLDVTAALAAGRPLAETGRDTP
jgi:ketosteroid isomerase-like protein